MDLIKIRKDLHQIPEMGFQEFETQAYLLNYLKKFENMHFHRFPFTGILAEYKADDAPYILIRADMDGLPIEEKTGCDFSSKHEGMMHACGHDIHMTILIGLIEEINRIKPKQNFLFLFQPAEEGGGGAEQIIESGILKQFDIREAFALHVNGSMPVGSIAAKSGTFFANSQEVNVLFTGKSAHVAFPEKGKNALAAGVDFYKKLKDNLTNELSANSSYICEFGKMQAGRVMNSIAEKCLFEGTIRAFSLKDMETIKFIVKETVFDIADQHKLSGNFIFNAFYKSVINDDILVAKLELAAKDLNLDFNICDSVFTGEDFGYFTHEYPGLLFWLGAAQEGEIADLHSPRFLPSDNAIEVGINVFKKLILKEDR